MRRRGLTTIWPQYLDKDRTIREGRRISKEIAVSNPTVADVHTAARKLKLKTEIDPRPKYPRSTWDDPGLVLVDTKGMKKRAFLQKIAPIVQRAVDQRIRVSKQPKSKKNKTKTDNRSELLKQKIAQQQKAKKTGSKGKK